MRTVLAVALFALPFGALACKKPEPIVLVQCPEPPLVQDPVDPVLLITDASSPADVAAAYRASRLLWRNECTHRGRLLNAYRKPSPTETKR